jgi:hypothetical protein
MNAGECAIAAKRSGWLWAKDAVTNGNSVQHPNFSPNPY